jgi:phosphoribosylformylglycinamidine (FGAM) synthase-like amidotransferase family enzyme
MPFQNPMQGLRKQVEDVWCRATSEAEHNVVVEQLVPGKTEQMPVCGSYGDVTESGFKIKLCKMGAAAGGNDIADCTINHVVLNGGFRVGDACIHGTISRPREVMDAANLVRTFAGYGAQR